ncbi:hypothetical protein H8958_021336 [Nasalis larvatus]
MAAAEVVDTQLMLGVGLIQKGTNGEILLVWCYPSTTATLRNLLLRKCCLTDENKLLHHFVFGQYRRTWFYITTIEDPESSIFKKVTHFSIVLTTKDFNPVKYAAFTRILCRMYLKHGSPVKMMESYVAVLTKRICQSEENGSFLSKDFDVPKAYLGGSIKDIVSQFGMETIILHTALMLKKRIGVYHPKIEAVQEFTRTLPALV